MENMHTRQQAVVVAGFAGVGKSTVVKAHAIGGRRLVDLDSSSFSFLADGRRNPSFVEDYVQAVLTRLGERCVLFVSTHPEVRRALVAHGVVFYLVHPERECKAEYLRRFVTRGTPQLVRLFDSDWDSFIDSCEGQRGCYRWRLESCQYLDAACLESILGDWMATE